MQSKGLDRESVQFVPIVVDRIDCCPKVFRSIHPTSNYALLREGHRMHIDRLGACACSPASTTVPWARVTAARIGGTDGCPAVSKVTAAPRPPVRSRTPVTVAAPVVPKPMKPSDSAMASRAEFGSFTMICAAPASRAASAVSTREGRRPGSGPSVRGASRLAGGHEGQRQAVGRAPPRWVESWWTAAPTRIPGRPPVRPWNRHDRCR